MLLYTTCAYNSDKIQCAVSTCQTDRKKILIFVSSKQWAEMTDRKKKYMMDEARHVLSLVTQCVTQKCEASQTLTIVNSVPLFSVCWLATDQYGPYRLKQVYFCYACHSETIPTVGEDMLSVWVLSGGE